MLQSIRNSLKSSQTQAERFGYSSSTPVNYSPEEIIGFVENFKKFEESYIKYSKVESLVEAVKEKKIQITEREIKNTLYHVNNITAMYKDIISKNYKIIQYLQKAACPTKIQVEESKRVSFARSIKEVILLSNSLDILDKTLNQLTQRGQYTLDNPNDTIINIFDESLMIFDKLNHNIEIITQTINKNISLSPK